MLRARWLGCFEGAPAAEEKLAKAMLTQGLLRAREGVREGGRGRGRERDRREERRERDRRERREKNPQMKKK